MTKKIVVVDDNREFLELMETLLEQAGYEVVSVSESLKARLTVRHERPSLVILDIMMPGQSGWELLDMLRLDPETKTLPILITTAAIVNMRPAAKVLESEGVQILPKPFNVDDLLHRVEALIGAP